MRSLKALALAAALVSCLVTAATGAEPAPAQAVQPKASATAPKTIEKVWYRNEKRSGLGNPFHFAGDLTLGERSLQLKARKKTITIPMEAIHVLSFGKMEGDVDTDWAVLGLKAAGGVRRVGFRDGRKLGYGQRTEEIYESIRQALKQAGAAQYQVPAGYRTYEALESQLTLAMPQDWTGYILSLVMSEERAPWGTIIFSAEPILSVERSAAGELKSQENPQALQRVLAGGMPAFFLEREPAAKGTTCKGLSQEALSKLMERAERDAALGDGGTWLEPPRSEQASMDGCSAVRIQGRCRRADGHEVRLDLRAVAHGDTLYLFGLRAPAEDDKLYREPFETAMASVRFSVAR